MHCITERVRRIHGGAADSGIVRRAVAQHCLPARNSKQAFPADTFTQRNSLPAYDQRRLLVAADPFNVARTYHEAAFVALFVHQYGIPEPLKHAPCELLASTAF